MTKSVGYQSVRMKTYKNPELAKNAEIAVAYWISSNGELSGMIYNKTNEILIIDQTMTFFVDSRGQSNSFYDPTVRQTTVTDISSDTKGASVNLGAIGGALGVGGTLGSLLGGVNVGGSGTTGQATAHTTIEADQPRVSIGPRGSARLSKTFAIGGIGYSSLKNGIQCAKNYASENNSPIKFSVCISYSIDGGNSFKKLITNMYLNSEIVIPVTNPRTINDDLRQLYSTKPNALNETWWILCLSNNLETNKNNAIVNGGVIDFQ